MAYNLDRNELYPSLSISTTPPLPVNHMAMNSEFPSSLPPPKPENPLGKTGKPRKWVKQWVTQESILNNGKFTLLKWVTEESTKVPPKPIPQPTNFRPILDILHGIPPVPPAPYVPPPQVESPVSAFACPIAGCGKVFTDSGALRKHAHVHGERQYICQYQGCGKRFVDSSKLKRHHLIHTGEKHFICPFEGCGKAFSLDFNRRSHMRTHTGENYHTCPVLECGKRFAHENKLRTHMQSAHCEKVLQDYITSADAKQENKRQRDDSVAPDKAFPCPYPGCSKRYTLEYKLNAHCKKDHGGGSKEIIGITTTIEIETENVEEEEKEATPSSFDDQGKSTKKRKLVEGSQ